jgi:signal transduction histidine kinase/Tfp pilus assembly protein PilF
MKIFLKIISLLLLPSLIAGQQENPNLSSLYRSLSDAKSDTARMKVYHKLAYYNYSLEDRDSSNFYLEKALSIAVRLNLRFDEASILNAMGVILMQQEKFSKSLEFYLKALNIAKDPTIENTIWHLSPGQNPRRARVLLLSDSYDLIGLLNAYTGNWIVNTKNQLKNYREAEKYAKAAGDTGRIAYINFHMGIAYMNEGKLDSALTLIKKAISTFSDLKDQSGLGRAMKYLGDTYERMGDFDLAANTLLQAIALLKETNDHLHLGLGYISLSRIYAGLKKNDSALYYARESLKIFEKRKDPAWKRDAYNLLTSSFDQLGRTDSAIVYLKLAKSLSDSLSVEVRKNLLAFLDVVVDEQAKLEKLEKEKIETREKLRIYLLLSGIVVFMVIVFLLYRNNRHRRKTNETLRQRNEKIENALHQLRSTQTQLIQSEKMASLGELTAGIAHEIQNPLNFVNNFSDVNTELIDEAKLEMSKGNTTEVKTILNDIKENEQKINHHGRRADAIVKNMLQHSRSSSGKKEPTDINKLADEYLRLSYHGLRAKDKSFNATMKTDFDESVGKINIIPQDMGRVILNLINNAFYAVDEKNKAPQPPKGGVEYEPTVSISTKKENGKVEIKVADNGNGIPQKILDKIFHPFFTTKPTGQGTGLGLSLSYDIVKAHGGELKVETNEGQGSEFIISLPLT